MMAPEVYRGEGKMMKKRFLVGVFMVAVVALSVAQVLTQTWTSATISMHAGTVSTVGIALFEDCATTVPINSWDWNGVTQDNTYELHVYIKNTGTETLVITYLPTLIDFYDNQAQFRLDVTVMEFGMPCQLYLVDWVPMPEKDVAYPELGYELPPGKVIKVDIELTAIMVVSGGVYDWDFSFYGATV